jgi:hypothetical protein
MNERIRELAQKAYFHGDDIWLHSDRLERFAELIVRECAELATKEYNNRGAIHGNDLLQHFGVEK